MQKSHRILLPQHQPEAGLSRSGHGQHWEPSQSGLYCLVRSHIQIQLIIRNWFPNRFRSNPVHSVLWLSFLLFITLNTKWEMSNVSVPRSWPSPSSNTPIYIRLFFNHSNVCLCQHCLMLFCDLPPTNCFRPTSADWKRTLKCICRILVFSRHFYWTVFKVRGI